MTQRWIVVGGGMLGMTLALRLAQRGQTVVLCEAADHLGGLADAWQLGDVRWDRHYHVTLLSDSYLRTLLAELSLEREIEWVETKMGFFTDGRLHSMSNTLEFLGFPPLSLVGKLRLGLTILRAARVRNWRALENVPVADWLRRWSGKETTERIWLPLLRAKLGDNYQRTSAAFIWATIARMYAARRTGLKKEMFGYVPGGYGRIVATLQEQLLQAGVDVRLDCSLRSFEPGRDGQIEAHFSNSPSERYEHAILTVPAPSAARLCPCLSQGELDRLSAVRYQGVICTSLLLRRPLADYYVTNITDEGLPFTATIEMTSLARPQELGGFALIYLPNYVAEDSDAFEASDEAIHEECLRGLERMYANFRRSEVVAVRTSRARRVMAIPEINYSDRVPPRQTSVPGLSIVTSAQIVNATLNVNETIRLAEEAATALVERQRHEEGFCNVEATSQLVAGS